MRTKGYVVIPREGRAAPSESRDLGFADAVMPQGATADPSTSRPPDPHNHPNERKGGARWGPRKEAGRKFFVGAALRMTLRN